METSLRNGSKTYKDLQILDNVAGHQDKRLTYPVFVTQIRTIPPQNPSKTVMRVIIHRGFGSERTPQTLTHLLIGF